jgi:hypothetical protein
MLPASYADFEAALGLVSFSDFGFVATFCVVLGAALAGAFTAFVALPAGSFLTAIYEMLL